jgi:hypothetical protein
MDGLLLVNLSLLRRSIGSWHSSCSRASLGYYWLWLLLLLSSWLLLWRKQELNATTRGTISLQFGTSYLPPYLPVVFGRMCPENAFAAVLVLAMRSSAKVVVGIFKYDFLATNVAANRSTRANDFVALLIVSLLEGYLARWTLSDNCRGNRILCSVPGVKAGLFFFRFFTSPTLMRCLVAR